ncbi:leukocyte-associated immunoglobulin-like receptor 1 isoform X2 [Suricata suricatta]|uniref:leukocyte-associated immunoglobulin-like receptor 1 isoform X2 n=1 Tax=Suricata suricatta TaxID=37032 RepID=UPI001155C8EF|nr:leukocyte-associated immunoglobulin-like receptor 1 isoform X2 [Suricata suricatta]
MCPHSTTFLALALCLGPGLHAQKGSLPPPLIHAEPGPEVPLGQRVTIVCRSLAAYEVFRLEKEGGVFQQDVHQRSPRNTEARFRIAAGTGAGGRYQCLYHVGDTWSDRSETLALVVTGHRSFLCPAHRHSWGRGLLPTTDLQPNRRKIHPAGIRGSQSRAPGDTRTYEDDSKSPDLSTEHVYILVGVSVALFLCLLLLALALLHCQRRKKRKLPSSQDEEQRPQERVSPAVDIFERTPDPATVDRLPEKDRAAPSSTPPAGSPQDVTYAQLDHRVLTQRTARGASPLSTEPTAESSTYASLARR